MEAHEPHIHVPEHLFAGVLANYVDRGATPHEFTLDFARLDPREDPPTRGELVARVSFSVHLLTRLLDLLQEAWSTYAEHSMPREARGNDEDSSR